MRSKITTFTHHEHGEVGKMVSFAGNLVVLQIHLSPDSSVGPPTGGDVPIYTRCGGIELHCLGGFRELITLWLDPNSEIPKSELFKLFSLSSY